MTRSLAFLSGLAIIGVVISHAAGWGFTAMFWWTPRYLPGPSPNFGQMYSASYWTLRTLQQLVSFAVPAFLAVSGYVVAASVRRDQPTIAWGFLRVRLRYLLIPYLLWTAATLLADWLQGTTYDLRQLLGVFLLGQAAPPFYFTPLLCQLYLLSPLLVPLARKQPIALLAAAALVQTAVHVIRYNALLGSDQPWVAALSPLTAAWLFPRHIVWFVFGIVYAFHRQPLMASLARYRWGLLAATLILLPLGVFEWEGLLRGSGQPGLGPAETLLDNVYAAAFLLTFLAFDSVMYPLGKPIMDLGKKSFGLYLAHFLALTFVAKAIYHLAPKLLGYQLPLQLVLVAAALGVPLLLMALVWRSPARRLYPYLFG